MRREEFLSRHAESWSRLSQLLSSFEGKPRGKATVFSLSEHQHSAAQLDVLYRRVCRHLALARQREYGDDVTEHLNDLALRTYRLLYAERHHPIKSGRVFLLEVIPSTIRSRWRVVLVAAAAFAVPLVAMSLATLAEPSIARTIFTSAEIKSYEQMYDPHSSHFARVRPSDGDFAMFGYYIANNVGIAFRTFAWGLPGGIGSLFLLVFNGLAMGAITGYLAGVGYGGTFLPFVAGHSAFELTGIILSGAAGIDLGWAILAPGRLTRLESLRRASRHGVALVTGAFVLILFAAFVEAYWSSMTFVRPTSKYGMAAALWALVVYWIARPVRHGR